MREIRFTFHPKCDIIILYFLKGGSLYDPLLSYFSCCYEPYFIHTLRSRQKVSSDKSLAYSRKRASRFWIFWRCCRRNRGNEYIPPQNKALVFLGCQCCGTYPSNSTCGTYRFEILNFKLHFIFIFKKSKDVKTSFDFYYFSYYCR